MVFVPAHDVDLKQLNVLLKDERELRENNLRYLDTELRATNLHASAVSTRRSVDVLSRLQPESADLITWCTFVAEARAALFTLARRPERTRWKLLGKERTLVGKIPPEALQGDSWRTGFWLAWATRDAHALELLNQAPVQLIVEWESFDRPLTQALQGVITKSPQTGEWLTRALQLADPAKVQRTDPDWVLNILTPIFECLVPLIDHDEQRFQSALVKLLDLRREYFQSGRAKGADSVQNLSDEGAGLFAWALALGFAVDVESPYLPAALVQHGPPNVVACVECVTPTGEGAEECHACGQQLSDDRLHFDFSEWLSLQREDCRSCVYRYPLMGRKCPVCLTARR